MPKREWETFEPPQGAVNVALKRCLPFLEGATFLANLDQDFIKTLMVSCYLEGVANCVQVFENARREGTYEEER